MFENFDSDSIKWWIEDHLKEIVILIVTVFIVIGGIKVVQISEDDGSPEGVEESLAFLISTSQELKNTFSLLDERDIGTDPQYAVKEVYLYVKEPFIEEIVLEQELQQYTEAIKLISSENGKQIKALRYILYDRKIVWEKGLKPKGTYEYRLPTSAVTPEDVNTSSFGTETQTYSEVAWDLTVKAKGKPKYDTYKLEGEYQTLRQKPGVDLLTDQEFEWFLKYDLYRELGGGFNLYLTWDLGAAPREEGRVNIKKQFDSFTKRLADIGDFTSYYDYADGIKRELVIEKPQFLYYAETGDVAKDDNEARQKLLEIRPSLYTQPINAWLDKLASEKANASNQITEESTETDYLLEESVGEGSTE